MSILIIEDVIDLAQLTKLGLEKENFKHNRRKRWKQKLK